jgi:hypothetical protein
MKIDKGGMERRIRAADSHGGTMAIPLGALLVFNDGLAGPPYC